MKKKLIILVAVLLVCMMVQPVLADQTPAMTITADGDTAFKGDTLTVTVSISKVENCTALGLGVKIDTTAMEVVKDSFEILAGSIKQSSFKYVANAGGYVANIQMDGAQTVSGDLFSFSVKLLEGAKLNTKYTISGSQSLRVNNAPTACTLNSDTVTVVCDHSYGDWSEKDNDSHVHTCTKCGESESKAHDLKGEVTKVNGCDQPGEMTYTCTVCAATRKEVIEPADHVWDDGEVTKEATCAEVGTLTYTCASCGKTETEDIPVTDDHSYGAWTKNDSIQHTHQCSVCKKTESAAHTWDKGKVTKEATCGAEGEKTYTCTACKETKKETIAKLTTHVYDNGCDTACNVCGNTREPSHKHQTTLSSDSKSHWYACSVCGDRKDETAHTPGPEATEWDDQVCTVCGYVIQEALGHTHKYADTYTTDGKGHWYACSGCNEKLDYYDHTFDYRCDPSCKYCGYIREIEHNYRKQWSFDETGHWYACEDCGETMEKLPHKPGPEATETEDQICQDCGYVIVEAHPHVHEPEGDILSDENRHWYLCKCGEKVEENPHTWDEGTKDTEDGIITYLCTACGVSRTEELPDDPQPTDPVEPTQPDETEPSQPGPTQKPDQPQNPGKPSQPGTQEPASIEWWWFAIIGVCVVLLGVVIFAIIGILASRKQSGKFSAK